MKELLEFCDMNKISNFGIFTLLLVSSLTIMVGTVVAPSLTGFVKNINFGFSPSWVITLPSLGVVVFAPFVGRLINRLGTLKLLSLGLVPYAILGGSGAFIANDYLLILNRFLLGAATVGTNKLMRTNIGVCFSEEFMAFRLIQVISFLLNQMAVDWVMSHDSPH